MKKGFRLFGMLALCGFAVLLRAGMPEGMAEIPAGIFTPLAAGAPVEEVSAFLLDVDPVTNAEFLAFVTARPEWRKGAAPKVFADAAYLRHWRGPLDPGPLAPPDSPVTSVSWFAARAYADWNGKRLPTLAEWERAASLMPPAAAAEDILAWYAAPLRLPLPSVDTGKPNAAGIRGLHGLVWEWTEDFDAVRLVSRGADDEAPSAFFCGGGAVGAADPADYAAFLRYAFRGSLSATHTVSALGFRCAQDLETEP